MNNPMVSIIIPVFNRQELVKNALDSVIGQTYSHWECIVVDDGSTDKTREVVEAYCKKDSRFKWYARERSPKGAPTCRNIGLEKAKGKFVVFLDSDDHLLAHCLQQRVQAALDFPDNDFWVFPIAILSELGVIKQELILKSNYFDDFLSANLPWTISNPLWKRNLLLDIRGFTEGYPRFNDPELMIRALLRLSVNYLVCNELSADAVVNPSIKDPQSFYLMVFKALKLFIPDTVRHLSEVNRGEEATYLIGYLRLWLKYYYAPNPKGKLGLSFKLILMFYRFKVITFGKFCSLGMRLVHFQLTKVLGLLHKDKLTNRAYYINQ
ncbi:glycosyltransferase family 2 protein [Mangrovimonas sp. DI 80]|uniref:glycosyltransferase family 2 protein n=1 Tax=Mangrovimonas sp. DI 80 TaxID=1779330 RepID=UPI00097781AD|nr:glycosyltransferase family 2 protein [Mangrovimonas sp. DI 80]OMP31160.1 hypothetical protein BKM32_08850 [Mangrovimonas sp. DI 80]